MPDVIVVGDGPAGLQCGLLLAKNDMDVTVYGTNETYLHDAQLRNYLGIEDMHGSTFAEIGRQQVADFGGTLVEAEVVDATPTDDGFRIETADGDAATADTLVLTEGDSRTVADQLDLDFTDDHVDTDKKGRTSLDGVYAGGWTARDLQIQAAISVGDGAAIALAILSDAHDKPFHDFDVPE